MISELDARDWEERYSDYAPNNSTSWIGCDKEIGPRSYGLVVTGDAMIAAFGISFTPGCKVIVDPGQRDNIKSGDKVVAKIEGVDGVLFRVFIEEAGKRFLKPLNAQYDNITDDFHILGKVIQKVEDV